ncbi:hypothetical protein NQ315_007968, partial [Exocentrus adspersus]
MLDVFFKCGIRGLSHKWIKSYLTGRVQKARLRRGDYLATSAYLPVTSGVPQGSILGPLLFIIFFDSVMWEFPYNYVGAYADDAVVVASFDDLAVLSKMSTGAVNRMVDFCEAIREASVLQTIFCQMISRHFVNKRIILYGLFQSAVPESWNMGDLPFQVVVSVHIKETIGFRKDT